MEDIPEEEKPTTMRRKRKRENQSKEEVGSPNLLKKRRNQRKTMQEGRKRPKAGRVVKARSCLFVIGSRKGELAASRRIVTMRMKRIVGCNTKIVERGGRKLKNLLSNSNP